MPDVDVQQPVGIQSVAVERRMAELGVKYVIQGCRDKVAAFDDVVEELEGEAGEQGSCFPPHFAAESGDLFTETEAHDP